MTVAREVEFDSDELRTNGAVWSAPTEPNGVVYVGSFDQNIYALNAENGAPLWRYPTAGRMAWSSPAVANGVLFGGSQYDEIWAFDVKNDSDAAESTERPNLKALRRPGTFTITQ